MFLFLWDSSYETYPTSGSVRQIIDDEERRLAMAIRERMEVEHNWGPYTEKDDGSHIPGKTTVLFKGSDEGGVSNPREGSLYLKTAVSDLQLFVYYDSEWHQVSTLGHSGLLNLGALVHSQYLLKTGGVMTGNLDMGGYGVRNTSGFGETKGGFVLGYHAITPERGHRSYGNLAAVSSLLGPNFAVYTQGFKWSGSLGGYDSVEYRFSSYRMFPPMFYSEDYAIHISSPYGYWGFRLHNPYGSSKDYRWNSRTLSIGTD